MTTLRIASVNGEWMNNWFTSDGTPAAFVPSFKLPGENISNSTDKTASKLAGEIKAIDPDVLAIEEAPSRQEELDLFVSQYLSGPAGPTYNAILGDSGGAQKLGLLYKSAAVTASLAPSDSIKTLLDPWEADPDGDMFLGPYQFTRTPLVINSSSRITRVSARRDAHEVKLCERRASDVERSRAPAGVCHCRAEGASAERDGGYAHPAISR